MKSKIVTHKFFYPILIFFIWLITYLISTKFLSSGFEWDEAKYLACAKGIAEKFDFSSRSTTVLGLIKYGFPHHITHYPLHCIYLAIFFKLFGSSLSVACFATWVSGLVTMLLIYSIVLLLIKENTPSSKLFAFCTSVTFLFLPRIINQCNSAMMEIPSCALILFFIFIIFQNLTKGCLNPYSLAIMTAVLFFYKSLFVGVLFGSIFLLWIICRSKELKASKSTFSKVFLKYLITLIAIYCAFKKIIFLPFSPLMNFSGFQEGVYGVYADFDGGFFKSPINNLISNLGIVYKIISLGYFPKFQTYLDSQTFTGYFLASPVWLEFGVFCLTLFYVIVFLFLSKKKLSLVSKAFIAFTIASILSFNLIFNLIVPTSLGPRCRYNLGYVPILLISMAVLLWVNRDCFNVRSKKVFISIFLSLVFFVYVPLFNTALFIADWNKALTFEHISKNTEIVKTIIGKSIPDSVYFTGGTNIVWDMFPVREIYMEVSNEQIKRINQILPKPIDFLFLNPNNNLFKQNQELILKGQPIIDNCYTFHGINPEARIVVYRFNPSNNRINNE